MKGIPKSLRHALVDKDTTLARWAEDRGFRYNTALAAVTGARHGEKSKEIRAAVLADFGVRV